MITKRFQQSMILIGAFGLLICLLSVSFEANWITNFDGTLHTLIRTGANRQLDTVVIAITTLGNPYSILGLTTVMTVLLIIRQQWPAAFFLLLNMVAFSSLNHLIKIWVTRPRPPFHHLVTAGGYSFPSGHASGALLFCGTLSILAYYLIRNRISRRLIIFGLLFMALLVGLSRIYVQVHYPSDVLAGYALASLGLGLSWSYFDRNHLL